MTGQKVAVALLGLGVLAMFAAGCSKGEQPATAEGVEAPPGYLPAWSPKLVAPKEGDASTPPPAAQASEVSTEAKADDESGATAKASPEPPPAPQQRRTWPELEDDLAELREKAKTDFNAAVELRKQYDRLAHPAFTESENYEQHIEQLTLWKTELPNSPTARVVLADAYIKYAWEARGVGVAATVTADGAHHFIQRIQDAQALLDSAVELGVADAHAYKSLITVAMARGLPLEQTTEWYEAGKKLTPDYMALHTAMAEYLRPEWHGEPGDLEAFANRLVTDLPGDEGLCAFGHVAGAMNCYDWGRMFRGVYAKESLNGAARVFLERYPDNDKAANYAGLFAWAGGDMELARKARQRIPGQGDPMVFASDDRFRSFDRWCKVSSVPKGERARLWASLQIPYGLKFASDSRYVWCGTGNGRYSVHQLDTETGKEVQKLYAPGGVYDIEVDSEDKLVVAPIAIPGVNGVAMWNVDEPVSPRLLQTEGACRNAAISPDGSTIAYADGSIVKLLSVDAIDGEPRSLSCGTSLIEAIEFSGDGKLLAARVPEQIVVWNTEDWSEQSIPLKDRKLLEVFLNGRPFFFDQENRLTYLTLADRYSIVRHDAGLTSQKTVHTEGLNLCAAVSPDGQLVVDYESSINEPMALHIWSVEKKKIVQKLEGHVCQIFTFAFSPDSKRLATGSADGEVKIWDLEPGLSP